MQKILEHTKIIGNLEQNKIYLGFIRNCNLQDLINCCKRIKNNNIDNEIYDTNLAIQKELIIDKSFIDYLVEMNKNDIDLTRLEKLCSILQEHNEKISNYSLDILLQILKNENIIPNAFFDYLKYFSNNIKTSKEQNIVINNLCYFYNQSNAQMSELTEKERELFFLEFMSDRNLIPIRNIKEVCNFLIQDNELRNIMIFLYSSNLKVPLDLHDYELIHNNSNIIFQYIKMLDKILDNENMYQLLLRWLENGANIYDLKFLINNLQGIEKYKINKIFYNRSSYINFIFGSKLKDFPLEDIRGKKEKILIYAISNNKKRFIQLIQENSQEFLCISESSLLFETDFYEKYVNLNTLTLKNLQSLQIMETYNNHLSYLNGKNYTFEEIALLYKVSKQYVCLYNYLLDLKIDERMLIIKQLVKRNLLFNYTSDKELESLAEMFKIKNLYQWIEKDFAHINDLKIGDAVKILLNFKEMERFIPQIKNEIELSYVLRNLDKIQGYKSLDNIKENIENIDAYWSEFVTLMNFSKEFIEENKNTIKQFLLNNGAELALKYCKTCRNTDLDSFKKIVKAELMGQFLKLKYYTDDLHKEIDFNLKDKQISEWKSNNIVVSNGEIQVKEYDDFYSTMILGESPQHTCLSYNGGAYNHCLMACFDSNKKILYAKIDNHIVARAMIRLTKGTYQSNTNKQHKLYFVDLENIKDSQNAVSKQDEYLTIFLERPYIARVSLEQEKQIKKMFISLLEKKATLMNALLVLSSVYSDVTSKEYVITKYYMYISKSKAGVQYLDSLSGENRIIDEGQYKANTFMVWQN